MTHLGPLENPAVKATCPLPLAGHTTATCLRTHDGGVQHRVELDSWADKPTIWMSTERAGSMATTMTGAPDRESAGPPASRSLEEADGKLTPQAGLRQRRQEGRRAAHPAHPLAAAAVREPGHRKALRGRGRLRRHEGRQPTGRDRPRTPARSSWWTCRSAPRTCASTSTGWSTSEPTRSVARYDPARPGGRSRGTTARNARATATGWARGGGPHRPRLVTPGHRSFSFWHLGGIDVSPKGHLVGHHLQRRPGMRSRTRRRARPGEATSSTKARPTCRPSIPAGSAGAKSTSGTSTAS